MYQLNRRALIVAHFNQFGMLRQDTVDALHIFANFFDRVSLVSTNLKPTEKAKLPESVRLHVRENIGYDFYSYRDGIKEIIDDFFWTGWQLTVMNTSFVFVDFHKFYREYILGRINLLDFDCYGLTKSYEIAEHIQSFLVTFSPRVTSDSNFLDWWEAMTPINERQQVIVNYEVGLSQRLIQLGYKLDSALEYPSSMRIPNPSHGAYLELLDRFGVLKIEVFKSNPFRMNLAPLRELMNNSDEFKKVIAEGLEN